MQQHPLGLKKRVQTLRAQGKTFTEIMRKVGKCMPKGTLSYWCKHVSLPEEYRVRMDEEMRKRLHAARKLSVAARREQMRQRLEALRASNMHLVRRLRDMDTLKMLLAMLYLGEGAKWRSHRGLMLGSADPNIIRLYITLLHRCYGMKRAQLKCRITYRADQHIGNLQKYWSRITLIPEKNFYKTKPDPRTNGKPTVRKDYRGVCVVTCAGTHIQQELDIIANIIFLGL
jgi:hypothetical protein